MKKPPPSEVAFCLAEKEGFGTPSIADAIFYRLLSANLRGFCLPTHLHKTKRTPNRVPFLFGGEGGIRTPSIADAIFYSLLSAN